MKIKEQEIRDYYRKEKDFEIELERNKFNSKLESMKSQFKVEYERQFRVNRFFKISLKIYLNFFKI